MSLLGLIKFIQPYMHLTSKLATYPGCYWHCACRHGYAATLDKKWFWPQLAPQYTQSSHSLANLHGFLVVMPEEIIGLVGLDSLAPILSQVKHCGVTNRKG